MTAVFSIANTLALERVEEFSFLAVSWDALARARFCVKVEIQTTFKRRAFALA